MSNVPKLRFKEFSGEWEENNLKKLSELITKGTTPKKFSNSGITFVKIEGINNLSINKDKCLFIDENTHSKELKRSILKEQDILFAIAGSLGKVAVVTKNILPANTNQALSIIRLKNKDYLNYILFVLQSRRMKKYIYKNLSVGAQPNLSLEQIGNFNFFLPLKQEQEKIASFLTSVDTRIEQLTKKEELLQQYKKGVMQKIFNQEIRFKADDGSEFCEWKKEKLSKYLIEYKNKSTFENEYPVLTSSNKGLMLQSDYFGENRLTERDNIGFNIVPSNFITYRSRSDNRTFTFNINTLGYIGIISTYYPVFECKNADNRFMVTLLNKNKHFIGKYSVGTSQTVLSFNELKNIKMLIPCVEEQTKIANFLSSIDTKIEQTQKQLESSKEFKKALLQQMFV
ncbi:restriction endonuclease subunit S [Arcobacter aquimarinus]|uniref:Type I restriction/modification system, specificity subunit n=1 Tax=Arcobacter aquimarinus TaxID=1315211 RepID=A0AAE7B2J0_9BACT|nr:restriction endonuclease subunit S [Arcobacter aquimarinus]QKE26084.1 type I restriction/modification system, specificity subunit [Arcobacter aquimarinus]RXI36196.1 restriction endonuclease subunit S [Arcobacter aquimarinus]